MAAMVSAVAACALISTTRTFLAPLARLHVSVLMHDTRRPSKEVLDPEPKLAVSRTPAAPATERSPVTHHGRSASALSSHRINVGLFRNEIDAASARPDLSATARELGNWRCH